jgi:hypothetical protein
MQFHFANAKSLGVNASYSAERNGRFAFANGRFSLVFSSKRWFALDEHRFRFCRASPMPQRAGADGV